MLKYNSSSSKSVKFPKNTTLLLLLLGIAVSSAIIQLGFSDPSLRAVLHSGDTTNILEIEDASNNNLAWFTNDGTLYTEENLVSGSNTAFYGTIDHAISANRTWTLPDATATMVGTDIANQLTNTELTSGVFAKITGIGTQTQTLAMGSQNIDAINDVTLEGRMKLDKGVDIASAGIMTLGADGNTFDITGTTTINEISPTSWQVGSIITLQFDSNPQVTHNSGGTNDILLGDQANFATTASDVLTLFYNGVDWVEVSRSVVGGGGSQTPWTSDIDGDGFNLDDAGVIFLREQAEGDADVAGAGQIWVDTQTPNKLFFTDDAGTDFDLTAGGGFSTVYKTADETITNDSTLTDDADLQFSPDINSVYAINLLIQRSTSNTPDFKYAFSIPTGSVNTDQYTNGAWSSTGFPTRSWNSATTVTLSSAPAFMTISGILQTGSNTGTFAFQWAQATSDAANTTLEIGSWMMFKKLS